MRGRELSFEDLRIDFERGFVLFPALLVLVLGEQVGAEILEDQGRFRIDLERLAVHSFSVVIFLHASRRLCRDCLGRLSFWG